MKKWNFEHVKQLNSKIWEIKHRNQNHCYSYSVLNILLIIICLFFLAKAMTIIPVGFTYATYGGLTIIAVTLFGIIKYNQSPNIYGTIGIILIIVGVILVNYLYGSIKCKHPVYSMLHKK